MALTWDLNGIKDLEEIRTVYESSVTDSVIWATLFTGIGNLTEASAPELFARIHMMEVGGAPLATKNGKPELLTPKQIDRRVGLKTNAGSETRAQWLKRIGNSILDESRREYDRKTAKAATEGGR